METTNAVCPLGCHAWWVACLLWWLGGSALLWATWNKVIGAVTKLKPVKYWQALLFLTTVAVLCGPRMMMHHQACGMHDGDHCRWHGEHSSDSKPDAK